MSGSATTRAQSSRADGEAGVTRRATPELWGGVECSVVRVGDDYRQQIAEMGVALDLEQLRAVAALGIVRLRFPVLWETVSPTDPAQCEWGWHDERLRYLRGLGVKPIAGLVHHGSGPAYTHLLDRGFAEGLAVHAARVAARYPWIDAYTPVNEPLTTARFSALYGHWYPHRRDGGAFLQALVNQCRATVLAMRAIRTVNPAAQLIQTEDLGKTYATPLLQYQADYENQRRWLSYDLLNGLVDADHPMFRVLTDHGIDARDLDFLVEHGSPPDVIGVNHYLTGERYLDENLAVYPAAFHGGNGRHAYADAEAVRVPACAHDVGPAARLREVWRRYRRPIAVTEVHHGCSRDEQVRWLRDVWQAAGSVRAEGADIRAVTVWSMFGAIDWNTLLVRRSGFYEPGAFDARSTPPRPTLLAEATRSLARTGRCDHPAARGPGWWHRPERFYAGLGEAAAAAPVAATRSRRAPPPLLITGATGTLGRAFARICAHRGLAHVLLSRVAMEMADPASIRAALDAHRPWAVVNTAGYGRVADAEREPDRCFRDNTLGAGLLAEACGERDIPFVTFSSDRVFDGAAGRAYVESDAVTPSGIYGRSKAEAEQRVLQACSDALVVRSSAFFGPWDRGNFVHDVMQRLHAGQRVSAPDNAVVSPTYVPDLVHATLDLLQDGERGLWHLANDGALSWFDLARSIAARMALPAERVAPAPQPRGTHTALGSERGRVMPSLDSALARFERDCEVDWRAAAEPITQHA